MEKVKTESKEEEKRVGNCSRMMIEITMGEESQNNKLRANPD